MTHARAARARPLACGLLLTLLAVLGGCGQRGPLRLPDSAQPVERLDPAAAQPPADAAQPSQNATAQPSEDQEDEEPRENER